MERLKMNSPFKEDENLLKQMKEAYLNCPIAIKYVRSLKIPDEVVDREIVKIFDFVSDINFCKKCPGVDKCNKDTPRLVTRITYEEGVISRELILCKEYYKDLKFKTSFIVKDFDEDWFNSDLRKIDKGPGRAEVVKKYKDIITNDLDEWIYIYGEAGTGRSFLAANLAIDLAKQDKGPIAFIDAPTRFKELGGKKDEAFNSLLEKYCRVPILVIDDLGNEYTSDFVRESILFPILNQRAKNHLLTIITSDYTIDEIATMYTKNPSSKPKVEAVKRLLVKMCGKEINQGELSIY